jgi:DNA methylase
MYRGHRFPAEVISYAVWLYFRFPLSLRIVEEILAARGICVTYETVRRWGYPGASSLGSDARRGLKDYPTVKPTAMLEDALLDLTNRGDIVVDPFLGSGSTLIAAENTGRVCRGVELDPLYIDVIVRRYEAATGCPAVLIETGESFEPLAARRETEQAARLGRSR